MENEIYKDVPNYEGLYKVSNLGNVICLKKGKKRIMKQSIGTYGYVVFGVNKNGKYKTMRTHVIVCELFNEKPKSNVKLQVNHKDGNKQNNRADNLEFVTAKENIKHAFVNELAINKGKKRKAVQQKTLKGDIINTYPTLRAGARAVNGNSTGISSACSRKINTYKGFIWDYYEDGPIHG
ncbi:NUMOD4 motif-containing HNH endonuclease [Neobacillus mesonae]|uniref:HNH nuclease domain-containing protein n=1 Tax=Neobacillus mesonae TaxID=1193713 RepID=A0A3Q9QW36_9BACI|nr:NUMOD4 motif-containing HNH endonuclease [Neobacillus mesonae]AZU60103.1 hypothetical protein CHR53_01820 [Neobacillus mesonae]